MLVQHLLTERVFRKVFNNPDFLQKNVIAAEIEKVIRSITNRYFSRDEFLKTLDPFYKSIEKAAEAQTGYTEKQHFLNAVYEKFFQNFDKKQADTHGIVYTPQPIVDFMVRSVEEILKQEFGKSLSDKGVHILDPFTGTGNFITRIIQEIKRSALPHKYAEELHCNEIMLLPYYIASMNIEHAYMEHANAYSPFNGICLVDTFELADSKQISLFTTENTNRVRRQKNAPIRVVIGNPPYNTNQENRNDGNRNRKYFGDHNIEDRIADTYVADSSATLRNKLSDPYVRAFRWASDRIGSEGIVCLVTNSGFLDQMAFDGMRRNLSRDYSTVFALDLGGNVRRNPHLSGTTNNVFGIQVGVSVTLLVKHSKRSNELARVFYARFEELAKTRQKLAFLSETQNMTNVGWEEIPVSENASWNVVVQDEGFSAHLPMGVKNEKGTEAVESIFRLYSLGVSTNRDAWVFNHSETQLKTAVETAIDGYCTELVRWTFARNSGKKFVINLNDKQFKWTDRLVGNARLCPRTSI